MTEKELQDKIAELSAAIQPLTDELRNLREARKQKSIERIAEIGEQVNALLTEAEDLSTVSGLPFYRETFVEGIQRRRYDNDYDYWNSSEICW